jgi:hypothetical protein
MVDKTTMFVVVALALMKKVCFYILGKGSETSLAINNSISK